MSMTRPVGAVAKDDAAAAVVVLRSTFYKLPIVSVLAMISNQSRSC